MTEYLLDKSQLGELAERHAASFRTAAPFAHIVIDNFLPTAVALRLARDFPPTDVEGWIKWGAGPERLRVKSSNDKLGLSEEAYFPASLRHFALQLCSATFIRFVERLSGLSGLLADPFFSGCGLHSTGRGGRLMIHSDADRHPLGMPLHQAVNAILYLNEDWKEEYGGGLELWSRDASHCVREIAPICNRLVIFETHSFSYHGHPHPLQCPPGRRRNSIASYYYVLGRPKSVDYLGFRDRPRWVSDKH